ncbi:MAG: hypothetical protein SVE93_00540, partial [Candidatus Thermoplasmatota archaeon]|nr:hypothetical protein [Candidatus Thermoplasmatota archaeon]
MRFMKGVTVTVAALFILLAFSNAYAQSVGISSDGPADFVEPNKQENALQASAQSSMEKEKQMEEQFNQQPPISETDASLLSKPPETDSLSSDTSLLSSTDPATISDPTTSSFSETSQQRAVESAISLPRSQFAITEALLMVVVFIVLMVIFIPILLSLIPLSPFIGILLILMVPVNILFIFFFMVLPVILGSFADVSTLELPAAVQRILNDIGSKGTITEITFSYLKNLWSIVLNLPELAGLVGDLGVEDYANLIKKSGSLLLEYPSNLRALPSKILRNLFPTINALPSWLRQSPILLQVFPLLMYAMLVLPLVAIIGVMFLLAVAFTVTMGAAPILILFAAIPIIIIVTVISLIIGFVSFFLGGIMLGVVVGIAAFLFIISLLAIIGAFIGLIIGGGIGILIGGGIGVIAGVIISLFLLGYIFWLWVLIGGGIGIFVGGFLGLIIGGGIGILLGGFVGLILGALIGVFAFIFIVVVLGIIGLILGAIVGIILAVVGLVVAFIAVIVGFAISIPISVIALIMGAFTIPILGGLLAMFLLPLMLPVGPQAVKSYPATFRLFASLAENSIAIPVGFATLLISTLISTFRNLPGSLRAVFYHSVDFVLTPFIFSMRALPLVGSAIALTTLWLLGMVLATIFSPFILIAPVFIVLAMFVEGLNDKADGEDVEVLDDEEIQNSIENLPENIADVYKVIKRIFEMFGKAATTPIDGLLESLVGVNWLIVTRDLPDVLPDAMSAVGSAIPPLINSMPDLCKTLTDSGLRLTIDIFEMLSDTIVTLVKNLFALMMILPEVAVLIPQLMEILSVITINLPALIQTLIPASINAVEGTVSGCPEFFPAVVISTMGLNVISLQFARGVWRISMRVSEIIIQTLWYLILLLPTFVFDFDEFVTPWFGPRLFSTIGAACGLIPSGFIGCLSALVSLIIAGFLMIGMVIYIPTMLVMQVCTLCLNLGQFCIIPCTTIVSILDALSGFLLIFGGIIDACIQYPISAVIIDVIQGVLGLINAILEPINACLGIISAAISAMSLLTEWLLPIFFMILVILALFPLVGIVAALFVFALIYFGFYVFQILVGALLMACSGIFQSVVCVPLISFFEPVPVIARVLSFLSTLTSFYAFFIPPNFIEIITNCIPLGVNLVAACPALIFMPLSLLQTFSSTASSSVSALPSIPAYLGRLTDRIIFSFIAWIFALISLMIDVIVSIVLIIFAIVTGILDELLSLDILTNAPKIAILVLALIFVAFALIIDLVGIVCLRFPDMIDEYAYSILKSMAMMPVL